MRNSTSVYNAATRGNNEISVAGVRNSTVLGTKPQMVYINPGDYYIGLITALNLMKKEDKIVIINSLFYDVIDSTICSAVKYTRPDLPIYHSTQEEEIKQFLDSPKGCFIAANWTDFCGMETKNLILIDDNGLENKDQLLRCTTQLVYIQAHGRYSWVDPEYWDNIVPYQEQSDSYKQCMSKINEYYTGTEYKSIIDNILRTKLRIRYTQFKDSEVKQLKQEDLSNIIGDLLNPASVNMRKQNIQKLSKASSKALIEEILRMKEDTSEEKLTSLDILLEDINIQVTEILRDIDSLLDESSTESRLESIRGLSRDNIDGLLDDLWRRSSGKESSEEKRKKMEML
jgi:hypothetical protein